MVRDRWCDASWPAATSPGAGADRICLEIRFSCIGLTSGTGACPRGALRRTGSVLLLCGRQAGKKGRHRKGRECRVPLHENQLSW